MGLKWRFKPLRSIRSKLQMMLKLQKKATLTKWVPVVDSWLSSPVTPARRSKPQKSCSKHPRKKWLCFNSLDLVWIHDGEPCWQEHVPVTYIFRMSRLWAHVSQNNILYIASLIRNLTTPAPSTPASWNFLYLQVILVCSYLFSLLDFQKKYCWFEFCMSIFFNFCSTWVFFKHFS